MKLQLTYDVIDERYGSDIFTREKPNANVSKAMSVNRHVYE